MVCNIAENRQPLQTENLSEATDVLGDGLSASGLPFMHDKAGPFFSGMSKVIEWADFVSHPTTAGLGKITAAAVGGLAGGVATHLLLLGAAAFVPFGALGGAGFAMLGVMKGAMYAAGMYLGSNYFVDNYSDEYKDFYDGLRDDIFHATNGSDPASDGCDDSSGFGTFYDGLVTSPIVLDMDGDGVELISLAASDVYFDMDNDDFAEVVGWVQPDDAFLAMDHNGNGVIDNQNELFGNTGWVDAFDKLDAYDSNHDNKITSADAQFGRSHCGHAGDRALHRLPGLHP